MLITRSRMHARSALLHSLLSNCGSVWHCIRVGTHQTAHAVRAHKIRNSVYIYMNMHAHTHRCHRDDTCMRNIHIVWMWRRHSTSVIDRCQQVLLAALLCCMYARMRCAALRPYRCGRCEDVEVRLAHHSTAATATKLASKYHCHYLVHD